MGFAWFGAGFLPMGKTVFLFCKWFVMRHPALELSGLWEGLGVSVEMDAFGRALIN